MEEITQGVNWLAVGISTVISFMAGWFWYSPKAFGIKWAEGVGVQLDPDMKPPALPMIVQLLFTFMLSWLIAIMAASNALLLAILMALTVMAGLACSGLWGQKSNYAIAVEIGFIAVMVSIMVACQALF